MATFNFPLTTTSPLAKIAAEIQDSLVDVIDDMIARNRWLLMGNPDLEDQTPVQYIKAGRANEVRKLVEKMKAKKAEPLPTEKINERSSERRYQ